MKEITIVDVSICEEVAVHRPDWETELGSFLDPLGAVEIQRFPNPLCLTFIYDRYSEKLEDIWAVLIRRGFYGHITVRREYTQHELLEAEFLDFGTKQVASSVEETLKWQTVPLCSHCGFQEIAWDFAKLHIKEKPKAHELAKVDWHPKVVSASLAKAITAVGFTGLELKPTGDTRLPVWYALQVTHTLPPMQAPPTRLKRLLGATAHCERDHNWERPNSEFYYRREGFKALDFNQTYELFGDSGSASRAIVISNRTWRLLMELGVKQLHAEPVRFVE